MNLWSANYFAKGWNGFPHAADGADICFAFCGGLVTLCAGLLNSTGRLVQGPFNDALTSGQPFGGGRSLADLAWLPNPRLLRECR